jgi:CubicO group peptidase (beta-lactamase class C family)
MKIALRCVAVLNLLLLSHTAIQAQVRSEQIDSIFNKITNEHTPGVAVGVIRDNKMLFARGYGLANLDSRSTIGPKTNFRLASVTKQFTAMAIMLLVHDKKLTYDDPLTKIITEFPAYGHNITIRNLLNHTSGLKDYEELYMKEVGTETPPEKVPQLRDKDVVRLLEQQTSTAFPPGTKWEYSNSGYAVLAIAVERVSGKPFGDFLRDRIFRPLHMNQTVAFENGKNEVPNRAYGYREESTKGTFVFADQSPTSAVLGDGGIYASIEDMAKWDRALKHHTLLPEAEMQPALTPVKVEGGVKVGKDGAGYGFGWFLDSYQGHQREWHGGETIGFRTAIQRFPKDQLTIVVLSNRVDMDPEELALKVADLYFR